jgi:hypothetical protein
MRKIIYTAFLMVSIVSISCKNENQKDIKNNISEIKEDAAEGLNELADDAKEVYNNAKESMKSAFDDIKIPSLNNENAENHLKEYADYVKAQMNKGAESMSNTDFAAKTKEYTEKSDAYMKELGADAKASFKATMSRIDSKWEEAKIKKD